MKARVALKVRAGARRTELIGRYGGSSSKRVWKLHIAAPPVDGKANDAIVRFLADLVHVAVSAVRIVSGYSGVIKLAEIEGINPEQLERAMLDSHGPRKNPGSPAAPES